MAYFWETRKKIQIHVELFGSPIDQPAVRLTLTLAVFRKAVNYSAYHTDLTKFRTWLRILANISFKNLAHITGCLKVFRQ